MSAHRNDNKTGEMENIALKNQKIIRESKRAREKEKEPNDTLCSHWQENIADFHSQKKTLRYFHGALG